MKFLIDPRQPACANANRYYEKSKKARQKISGAKKALEQTLAKIEKLEKEKGRFMEEFREKIPEKKDIRKKEWFEKFRGFRSSDNFLVVGGKDATTNEILIKKHTEKNDLVFHADVQGAPFFVIKNPEGKEISESTISETAQAAASYSKAWASGMGSCDVYYVKPEQVSKEAPAGQHIGKGAFMIYGKKNFLRDTPLEIGIGFTADGEIIGGPPEAITKNSQHTVRISSGDVKSGQLAKEIKELLIKNSANEKLKKARLEDIQRLIPSGKGRIIT
ncbi:MAG: NFACT RNA binding domain-containing protein [Candidatus Altiarchaeales archaeon]|nr:DUF814 domain-containing protein [Candidatus Altiarchaeota archaeon]MCG2783264.1 NFACT RNA binding domain-containing protein [Candidatus Altiarchaeales archaeon]MBU4267145.1 DUF814 domain-containing protein [Candidatus Altiarchaeota archaeon]MBU4341948.1 DUF814 domain-containing protein [Candidatus Altiarchaeota archaeon]MBU4406386.1 DUF814 domain-containing protein [Candidatus Altiarchaeota archaeon]